MKIRFWKSYKFIEVVGSSMYPNLRNGWYLLFKEKNIKEIKRKEIILYLQNDEWLIKRIIGLPNEFIQIQNSVLLVDAIHLHEDYLHIPRTSDSISQWQLTQNEYVLLGDNPNDSLDSRKFGLVNLSQSVFVFKHRIWPFRNK